MSSLKQQKRIAELFTPLGADELALTSFDAHEAMSEPFDYVVEAVSETPAINFDKAMGSNCAVVLHSYDNLKRWFNGVLVEAHWTGLEDDLYSYRLVLRPWFWVLSHTTDCRFFQEMTVKEIIQKVFDEAGYSDYEFKTSETYPKMEYCVQYRETHYAFVSRLMEEHGIYYFFKHSQDKHIMILADGPSAHQAIEGGAKRELIPLTGAYSREHEHLQVWSLERRFRSGRTALNDYDFKKPGTSLKAEAQASEGYKKADLEIYDYPGRYVERGVGEQFSKVRLHAERAGDHRRHAGGEAPSILPGGKMRLEGHKVKSENQEYIVVRAAHSVISENYRSTGRGDSGAQYSGSYVLQPANRPFKAPLATPKPLINGIQTAKVVGDEGEEITVDKHGRIKVQFHWDRQKKQSCWIRVAEMWSGKTWGSAFHPRHGQEVVVEFLEGDPDRPLVIGTVYNGDNEVPWALPAEKTKAGWKSDSTKGGGGFNEWRFEDKKGSEQVWLRAEKDHDTLVQNKETRKVGTKFDTPVGSSSRITELVNGDDEHTISKGNHKMKVGNDQTIDVEKNITITAGVKITIQIKNSQTKIVMDSTSITMTALNIKVDASSKLDTHGALVDHKADGMMNIKGGVININ